MHTRRFGSSGREVSEIGIGTWALGADWGAVDDREATAALHEALDCGMTFIDTADVYGDGRSERLISGVLKDRPGSKPMVATKLGRRLPAQEVAGYTAANMTTWVERSLRNLGVDSLDLVQLHCPPTALYYEPEVFQSLDRLVEEGKIRSYGVSVEKVEEALKALEFPNVASVQIIFNIFRQRPADLFFELAQKRQVAILARVPLASGLLSGKFRPDSKFEASDHRNFNRNGEAFDVGETFAGLPYEEGLKAVEELRPLVTPGFTMAQFALRWIVEYEAVTVVIPGAKNIQQARENAAAADVPPLSSHTMAKIREIYERYAKPSVHQRW